ncbi:MAG: hypothetical protein ACQEUG_16015 [Pseudomonadota bacterium]
MKGIIVLALVAWPLVSWGQVYKCEVNGTPTFQDRPCANAEGSEAVELGGVSRMQDGDPRSAAELSLRARQRIERQKRAASRQRATANREYERRKAQEQRIREARRAGIAAEGMSESQVTTMYGRPDRTNVTQNSGGTCKHLYWEDPYRQVMICDGEVASSYQQGVR